MIRLYKDTVVILTDNFFATCKSRGKGKGKGLPRTGHEGPQGKQRYNSTLSLTLALDEGGWSTPRPGRFTPGKESRYPLYRRLGGDPGLVWTCAENLAPTRIRSQDRPARSVSPYRLSYRGLHFCKTQQDNAGHMQDLEDE
jgi:hypothetical protein